MWGLTLAIKNIQTSYLVHDLKNPVTIIESGVRALLEKQERYGKLTPNQEKVIRRILRNALKIRHLANAMLEVDMAASGIVGTNDCTLLAILTTALVEVYDIVAPAVSDSIAAAATYTDLVAALKENGVLLNAEEAQIVRTIQVDETKLSLIMTNLLSNAFKYKQNEVRIECRVAGAHLEIAVSDDGPGIPDIYHDQVFDEYFQCSKLEGFPVRGHGLGLAGALALTEAMGGTLSLCKVSRGAEFRVHINLK